MIAGTTDRALIKELLELVKLAIDMRRLQRIYFRSRGQEALAAAREAEQLFDRAVAAFKMPTLI